MDQLTASSITTTGAQGFLEWLKRYQPQVYTAVKNKLPANLKGFGTLSDGVFGDDAAPTTTASPSWMDTITNALSAVGTAYLTKTQVDAQKDLWNIQLQRAQSGLAPLDINPQAYGLPSPSVNIGLASGTQKILLYGGIALAAVFLIPQFLGKRR